MKSDHMSYHQPPENVKFLWVIYILPSQQVTIIMGQQKQGWAWPYEQPFVRRVSRFCMAEIEKTPGQLNLWLFQDNIRYKNCFQNPMQNDKMTTITLSCMCAEG